MTAIIIRITAATVFLCTAVALHAQPSPPDTLVVFDAARETPGALPREWAHVLPEDQYAYTTYTIERSIDGPYLRARAADSGSWLELDVGEIAVDEHTILAWEWKVDRFPAVGLERTAGNEDFAIRIELVYDLAGSWKNPLNIIRKGIFRSIGGYPPMRTVSYVWSVNAPSLDPFESAIEKRTTIIPVESTAILSGRWLGEQIAIAGNIAGFENSRYFALKKIRLRADTDDTGDMAESGLKHLYLITP